MNRLILLAAPVASVLGGIFLGRFGVWMLQGALELLECLVGSGGNKNVDGIKVVCNGNGSKTTTKKAGRGSKNTKTGGKLKRNVLTDQVLSKSSSVKLLIFVLRLVISAYAVVQTLPYFYDFHAKAHAIAKQISHPTIIQKARTYAGEEVIVDDYREAYFWLRDNTPEDARILAWWDCTSSCDRWISSGLTWLTFFALISLSQTATKSQASPIVPR